MISPFWEVERAEHNYTDMIEDRVWLDGRFQKYIGAFKSFYSLNPDLELYVKDEQSQIHHLFVSFLGNLKIVKFSDDSESRRKTPSLR